jgi:hypothetical protein
VAPLVTCLASSDFCHTTNEHDAWSFRPSSQREPQPTASRRTATELRVVPGTSGDTLPGCGPGGGFGRTLLSPGLTETLPAGEGSCCSGTTCDQREGENGENDTDGTAPGDAFTDKKTTPDGDDCRYDSGDRREDAHRCLGARHTAARTLLRRRSLMPFPQSIDAGFQVRPRTGSSASSTSRLAGAEIRTIRSAGLLRSDNLPRKSSEPHAMLEPRAKRMESTGRLSLDQST